MMRFEFKVELKKVRPVSKKRYMFDIKNEPLLRQHLVLAYQIQGVIDEDPDKTLKQIAEWIGFSPARITQIMNLLFLAPDIQEEILLSEDKMLFYLSELKVEKIAQEVDWRKQKEIWKEIASFSGDSPDSTFRKKGTDT